MKNKKGNFFNRSHKNKHIEKNNSNTNNTTNNVTNNTINNVTNNTINNVTNNTINNTTNKTINNATNRIINNTENNDICIYKNTNETNNLNQHNKSKSTKGFKIITKIVVPIIAVIIGGLMTIISVIVGKINFNCASDEDSIKDKYTIENDSSDYTDNTYVSDTTAQED